MKRYIDGAVIKFMAPLLAVSFGLMLLIAVWVGLTTDRGFPYLNEAFVWSWVISLLALVPVIYLAKTRPIDKETTWGEAMVGATYVFMVLFWIYGTVPHQWLTYAESELNWRSDRALAGPPWGPGGQGLVDWALPFTITYTVVKDLIAVSIYVIGLVANGAMFVIWQKRGDTIKVDATEI